MNTKQILEERGKTHGAFTDNAQVSQDLKHIAYGGKNWETMSDVQHEALDMILHKVARLLSGNPNEPDHWKDIAGYAELVVKELK